MMLKSDHAHELRYGTHALSQIREVGGDDVREGIHVDATQEEEQSGRWVVLT